MAGKFKFKDLSKLGSEIGAMCLFAEQIKTKVHGDLEKIKSAKDFIGGVQETLKTMNEKLAESEKTLSSLAELLE